MVLGDSMRQVVANSHSLKYYISITKRLAAAEINLDFLRRVRLQEAPEIQAPGI